MCFRVTAKSHFGFFYFGFFFAGATQSHHNEDSHTIISVSMDLFISSNINRIFSDSAPGLGSSCHKGRRLPWSIKPHILDWPITTHSEMLRKIWREQRALLQSLVTIVAASYTSHSQCPCPHPGWMTITTHNLGHLTHSFSLAGGVLMLGYFWLSDPSCDQMSWRSPASWIISCENGYRAHPSEGIQCKRTGDFTTIICQS